MAKLFKSGKQILAVAFAFAVVAVSMFAGGATINADACDVSKIDYWDGTLVNKFESGTGTEASPYIIATAEQLAYCCLGQNPSNSSNKYYKVSDNVKTFVMQPESIVDVNELLALDSAEAVNEYFSKLDGKLNWIEKFNGQSFNGHFDGNGATIYGLYATTNGTTKEDVGLFPQYDGGTKVGNRLVTNVCKNIQVKNSYMHSKRRLGTIAGASYLLGYGAKVDGKITFDSCAVVNCYLLGEDGGPNKWSYFTEQGVVTGGGSGDIMELKNILIKGTYAYNTESKARINVIGNGSSRKVANKHVNIMTDSIVLGVPPYGLDYFSTTVNEPYAYTNVVTDFPSGEVDMATPTWESATSKRDFTDHIFSVTETGAAFKAAANMLDWKTVWFMGTNGPELRVFHSGIELTSDNETHVWVCNCCGLESAGGVSSHTFVFDGDTVKGDGTDVYKCSECDFVCKHTEQTVPEFDEGDCVTASGTYARCKFCDWYIVTGVGGVPGHKLTYVASDVGDCETEGHKEYWHCSVCNNKFTSDNVYAAMNTAVSDADLSTGIGPHFKEETEEGGYVIVYDDNGHWYKCSVNGGRLDYESNDLGENGVIKHKFKNTVCVDCGYQCVKHDYKATGVIDEMHGCNSDEKSEIKCTRCGYKTSVVTKEASHTIVKIAKKLPDDRMEGNKEHHKCTVCNEIYADAAGKTKITQTSLIIPKVLPEEYRDMVNADPGTISPSTGDSAFAPALVMMALAGAALVITRKKK